MSRSIPTPSTPAQPLWFYADSNNQPHGPVSFEELMRLASEGVIRPDTSVIKDGGNEWRSFSSLGPPPTPPEAFTAELQNRFRKLTQKKSVLALLTIFLLLLCSAVFWSKVKSKPFRNQNRLALDEVAQQNPAPSEQQRTPLEITVEEFRNAFNEIAAASKLDGLYIEASGIRYDLEKNIFSRDVSDKLQIIGVFDRKSRKVCAVKIMAIQPATLKSETATASIIMGALDPANGQNGWKKIIESFISNAKSNPHVRLTTNSGLEITFLDSDSSGEMSLFLQSAE